VTALVDELQAGLLLIVNFWQITRALFLAKSAQCRSLSTYLTPEWSFLQKLGDLKIKNSLVTLKYFIILTLRHINILKQGKLFHQNSNINFEFWP